MTTQRRNVATTTDAQRIFKERARALAKPLGGTQQERQGNDCVVLQVGAERYGIALSHVVETLPLENVATLPGVPAFWAGIVNVRGTIYPVLDLFRYFDLPVTDRPAGATMLMLVSHDTLTIGLMVDAVQAIARVEASDLGPALPGGSGGDGVVSAVTRSGISVLDVEALLGDPRLRIREEPS